MSHCREARETKIRLRNRRTNKTKDFTVICPASWTKGRFLAHVRAEHPDETVRLLDWKPLGDGKVWWRVWVINPKDWVA